MKAHLKTTDKAAFDLALKNAIEALGATLPEDWENPTNGSLVLRYNVSEEVEGETIETTKKLAFDYTNVHPLAKDLDGNFIVESTDEEGNETYQLAEGYHVNIVSSPALEFDESVLVSPAVPQFKYG